MSLCAGVIWENRVATFDGLDFGGGLFIYSAYQKQTQMNQL